ncbi:YqzL family protein [Terrilactibacillus sp. S3-3]|nr:YqzL family protein [Terrilactibacillus sp. S3-3]
MLDLTWKVFCMTGNIDTYLLLKEIEVDDDEKADEQPAPEDEFMQ